MSMDSLSIVDMLPVEILENIFNKIDDPIDLQELRVVCRTWRDIIDRMLEINPIKWSKLCQQNVPGFFSWRMSHYLASDDYRTLYLSWKNCQKDNRCCKSLEVPEFNGNRLKLSTAKITCMDVKCEILALGTDEGGLFFYSTTDIKRPFFVAKNCHTVAEVNIPIGRPDPSADLWAVSTCTNGHLKYWDISSKDEIASDEEPIGFFIDTTSVYSFVDCGCRRSGRYHASLNGLITTYDVARRRPTVKKDYQLLEDSENNKIVACGRNGIFTFNHATNTTAMYDLTSKRRPKMHGQIRQLPENIAAISEKKFSILYPLMGACVAGEYLAVLKQYKQWSVFNTTERFGGKITSICVADNGRLFIGLDNGNVFILPRIVNVDESGFDLPRENEINLTFDIKPIMFMAADHHFATVSDYIIVASNDTLIRQILN